MQTTTERRIKPSHVGTPGTPLHVDRSAPPPSLFDSFWLGGFESACQINSRGRADRHARSHAA